MYTAYFQAFGILLTILSGMPRTQHFRRGRSSDQDIASTAHLIVCWDCPSALWYHGMPTTAFSYYIYMLVLGAQHPVAVRGVVYFITASILVIYISHRPSENVQCVTQSNLP